MYYVHSRIILYNNPEQEISQIKVLKGYSSIHMTVSRSQRGEACEGWNDCPPMIRRDVSSTSLPKRRAHRIGSNYSSRDNSTNDLSSTLNALPVLPPMPKPLSSPIVSSVSSSQENVDHIKTDPVSLDKVELEFESFTQLPTKLSSKELDFYTNKIKKSLESLSLQDLQFLSQTILAGNETGTRQSIVEYMVLNDGVSSWCSPLKKLIENAI